MCGICGAYSFDNPHSIDKNLIVQMCVSIKHRGPDDEGYYLQRNIGLGHRRLSIIDLEGGRQPIHNEDKTIWIIFNGEIYNYKILTEYLTNRGHRFQTKSDTETIVHLYEEFEEDFVNKLRGMFAFAIWDEKRQKLILGRDRHGIKPIYYRIHNGTIFFGSEIKCLLHDKEYSRAINWEALDQFLTFSYIPGPNTIFKNIYKLLPAHMLICENSQVKIFQYWQLKYEPETTMNFSDIIEKTNELLKESIKLHMESDVPLGVFLSGGIDSSSVVALMSEVTTQPVNTFSIGYSDASDYFDELPFARIMATKYSTNHREFIVTPHIEDIIHNIIKAFDEPFADSSIIPSYYICKLAREHLKVVLSGLGGDELFGGYERYAGILLSQYYQNLPTFLRKNLFPFIIDLVPESTKGIPTITRLKRFINSSMLPPDERYFFYLTCFSMDEKKKIFKQDIFKHVKESSAINVNKFHYNGDGLSDHLKKAMNVDVNIYLPDDILTLTDRMSMMHSLEVRVPFLDHVLHEFVAKVPSNMKINKLRKKYLLIQAMQPRLPKQIINKKKIGFASPTAQWFRGGLKEFSSEILSEERIKKRGIFDPHAVKNILENHFDRKRNLQKQILCLLTFEIWCQLYLDN